MNGQTEQKLRGIVFFIFMILILFSFFRIIIILPYVDRDYICRFEYGENWRYDYDSNFGRTCIELDYISLDVVNRTEQNMTTSDAAEKYCDVPGFWELSKWEGNCVWED